MKKTLNSLEWIEKLIAFDTTSRNSNLALIACLEEYCAHHQLKIRLSHDPSKEKANLFATLAAQDGNTQGGLVLSGHSDVVPVDGQDWLSDPFKASIRDNRLYGRGSSDMKSFLALCMGLLPTFKTLKLKKPLHFAFTYDEEVGCHGAKILLADLHQAGIEAEGCIVGEPTELHPVLAHKGIQVFRCRIHGKATHSSLTPQGCNAIDYAAFVIYELRQLSERLKEQGPIDPHFDVPFTTLSTNQIKGGNALNTIPSFCEFFFEIRNLPGHSAELLLREVQQQLTDKILPKMQKEFPQAKIEIEALGSVPSFEANESASLTQLLQSLSADKSKRKVAYATEAGLYQAAAIPTILCGPGSIEQAHRANEYIELDQIQKGEELLRRVAQSLC